MGSIASPEIVLAPWPSRPTFTEATLTASPQGLATLRTIATGSWYAVRNAGDVAFSILEAANRPDPALVSPVTVNARSVVFVRGQAAIFEWVWGAGACIEISTAAWWRAMAAVAYAVPQHVGMEVVRFVSGDNQLDTDALDGLGSLAGARVEREAPGAPQAAKNEAVIRYSGYLAHSLQGGAGVVRKVTTGPFDREFVVNHANAWRHCGAGGLLAPWKVRRAGVIG
ncbi:MAG: hypothetical protein OXC08_06575 [Thiotrichales bacterium]|nr:hypothetical protein [Thiotrichales bacterium]